MEPHNQAITLLKEAAAAHHLPAIFTLGAYYELGLGVEKNLAEALWYHEEGAHLGFPQSMVEAGIFHEQGKGVPVDYEKSFRYYYAAYEIGFSKGACMRRNAHSVMCNE
jgi:TPR repeat protein